MSGTKITPELLADLKAKAEKATPGEWRHCFSRGRWDGWIIDEQNRDILKEVSNFRENAAYIAAANPAVVLALVEKIEELEEDFDTEARSAADESVKAVALEEEADWLAERMVHVCRNCGEVCYRGDLPVCPLHPSHKGGCSKATAYEWREAARNAVEKENEAHESAD